MSNRTNMIAIRVTDEEKRLIEQATAGTGLAVSAWARNKLLGLAAEVVKGEKGGE